MTLRPMTGGQRAARRRPPGLLLVLAAAAVALLAGCLYDAAGRCGTSEHFDEASTSCVCDEGAAQVGGGCEPCPAGDVVEDSMCACPAGSLRATDGSCELVPTALGTECSPAAPCTDVTYGHCAADPDMTDYCTISGCSTTDDCPATYTCTAWEAAPYCERPPTGLGDACDTSENCAASESTFCAPSGFVCLVQDCSLDLEDCPSGYTDCCDLSPFGIPATVCVPQGTCPT